MKFRSLLIFNLISLGIYFFVFIFVLNHFSLNELIFSSSDSKEYHDFGNWLISDSGYCSFVRPFLYPLISQSFYYLGGAVGLWLMQFIFYVVSINLIFISLSKITKNNFLLFFGSLLLSTNLTFIEITMHGLTEVTTILLLSILVYYSTYIILKKDFEFKNFIIILLLFSLLTVVKPVFSFFIWIGLVILLFKFFKNLKAFISILLILISLSPLIIQFSIMKINHNEYFISKIGEITLRDYYYRKLYADQNNISYNASTGASDADIRNISKVTDKASTNDILNYVIKHPTRSAKTYFEILYSNINTHSEIINGLHVESFTKWTENVNTTFFFIHFLFLIVVLFFAKSAIKFYGKRAWIFLFLYMISCFIILISGISFWQGDRLVLPSMPVWIFVYVVFADLVLKILASNRINKKTLFLKKSVLLK